MSLEIIDRPQEGTGAMYADAAARELAARWAKLEAENARLKKEFRSLLEEAVGLVDPEPNADYPARILRAHLKLNEQLVASGAPEADLLAKAMNEASAARAALLREAIATLAKPRLGPWVRTRNESEARTLNGDLAIHMALQQHVWEYEVYCAGQTTRRGAAPFRAEAEAMALDVASEWYWPPVQHVEGAK